MLEAGKDKAPNAQLGLINLLKVGATQLIILHHLAFYGPMAYHVRPLMPELIDWLDEFARIAVQVFLVIGGFLVAKSLSPQGRPGLDDLAATVWRRYVKLAPPFLVAMLFAIGASALASDWMVHDSISAPPGMLQLAAHALLLHGVLGVESLSAGAWYVAIDFQLYAATAFLFWLTGRYAGKRPLRWLVPVVVMVGMTISLLHFNRDADWDNWAPYFFGSYGLGVLAWYGSDPARRPGAIALLLAMILLPAVAALVIDFRIRIAVALATACLLFVFGRARPVFLPAQGMAAVNGLARISYSVFLIHFPVCLVVNAVFTRFVPEEPQLQAAGMLIAWGASLVAGAAFFRWVELPLSRAMASTSRAPAWTLLPNTHGRVVRR
jgi:peptidoglycan/LPS O-acetylase OafA/YrhL